MSYTETNVWSNDTTAFTTADEAIANIRTYLNDAFYDYTTPDAENVTFDSATQTLSFTKTWATKQLRDDFKTWAADNSLTLGSWVEVDPS